MNTHQYSGAELVVSHVRHNVLQLKSKMKRLSCELERTVLRSSGGIDEKPFGQKNEAIVELKEINRVAESGFFIFDMNRRITQYGNSFVRCKHLPISTHGVYRTNFEIQFSDTSDHVRPLQPISTPGILLARI